MSSVEQNGIGSNAVPAWLNAGKPAGRTSGEPSVAILGGAMPPLGDIPTLTEVVVPPAAAVANPKPDQGRTNATSIKQNPKGVSVSSFEEGWQFRGKATINGTCTIACNYEGQILETEGGEATVVVSPSGVLTGDIRVTNVSVMGRYSGTLDASGGRVELHASAVISGHVRYGQLQVNGADLNASLERVPVRGK